MKQKLSGIIGFILCIAIIVTSVPMGGIVALAADVQETEKPVTIVEPDYDQGNTDEVLRQPIVSSKGDDSDISGTLIDVGQYYKTYLDESGTFTSVITGVPNYYIDDKGKEQKYDNTLVRENNVFSADTITNKSSDIDVSLSENFSKDGISFEHDDVRINLIPTQGDYSVYSVEDNAIRYNNVFDGIDVQYSVSELGVNEYIILNKYVEKNSFSYKVKTNGNTVELADNVLVVKKGNSDEVAYTVSAPFMTDAAGEFSRNVILSYEDGILTVTADAQWLADLNRTYPVVIDPDISTDGELTTRAVKSGGLYSSDKYGYAGWIDNDATGGNGVIGSTKLMINIGNSFFSNVPDGIVVKNATLYIHQYGGPYKNRFGQYVSNKLQCFRVNSAWNFSSIKYETPIDMTFLSEQPNRGSTGSAGAKYFDISDAVSAWCNGEAEQYGLCINVSDGATGSGAAFYTATSGNTGGQDAFKPDQIPKITVSYELPNPVDDDYPLNQTTINLRTLTKSGADGTLAFQGVFADGLAMPYSAVHYWLNDSSVTYQDGTVSAIKQAHYPNTIAQKDKEIWNKLPEGTTKYRRFVSNWQTYYPFVNPEFNKLYYFSAQASKDGASGNVAQSDKFLTYKVTRFDTLQNIANYYGVSLEQLAKDNHVQDMLLVENNTIVIINPTQNTDKPYNPPALSNSDKMKIDGLLMGRGKHCEFGFEPVNLNTGNFYMNKTDISIPDLNGNFEISRTYNSKAHNINGMFGRGWQFGYDEHLAKLSDGSIAYTRGDGSTVNFYPDANGNYTCDEGYYLDLTPIVTGTKTVIVDGIYEENIDNDNIEATEKYTSVPVTYNVYEYEIKDAQGEVHRFSSAGQLIGITDKKGFKTALTYNDKGVLSSIVSAGGTTYDFSCDATGRITAIQVPGGTIRYTYNDAGDLIAYTDENGNTTTYHYDSDHLMTSWADAEGNVIVTNIYDAEGRVTKQIDAEGNTTLFTYSDGTTKTTDANGNVTVYHYDDSYRTTSIEYSDSSVEYKFYDSANNLAKTIDRSGNATEYQYNADGLVTQIKRFDAATQKFEYDADNNLTKSTDYDGLSILYSYDAKGNLLSQTNKDGTVKTYEYDANCRVIKSTDELGNATTYQYDGIWVSAITLPSGAVEKYYYNARGNLVSKTDALGKTTRYFYDAAGRNTGYQTADGATVSYTYDKAGSMLSLKNANGYVYLYEYDGMGNITKLTDPLSNEVAYTYDGMYNNLSTDYSEDHVTYSEFDGFSQVVSETDEEGNKTAYQYDKAGNVIEKTDAQGNTTKYSYDLRFNKLASETDALGNKTVYEYDAVGNLIKKTEANGAVTGYSYDAQGRVTEIQYSNGLVKTNAYDAAGNLVRTESNAGENTAYTYDKAYNVTSVTYSNGAVMSYTYDALGRKLTEKDSLGAVTTYTYDAMGRTASVTDSVGRKTEYTYDKNGNVLTEKTSNGGTATNVYDALDRQCKVTDALGNSTFVEYDNVGNMISTTNALGAKTAYEYNRTGLVTKQTDAMGGVFTFTYDKNGNIVKAKDAAGYEATMTYDALGRTQSTKDALGLETTFRYDAVGNLAGDANNNGVKNKYEYDSMGNLVRSTDSLGQVMSYTYDLNGNLTSVKSYDGTITSYTYDKLNNVSSMTDAEGKTTTYQYDIVGNLTSQKDSLNRVYSYSYDNAGRTIQVVDPLGQATAYEYNDFDLVTKQTNPDKTTISNEYDLGGNLVSQTDENGHSTTYGYDKTYRLISVAYADGTTNQYQYDANDNLKAFTDANGNVTGYTYNKLGYTESITEANGAKTTFTHDANGNVLSQTDALGSIANYVYDKESRLVSKTLANSATYTYSYDALGRLTAETLPEGLSAQYTYDTKGNLASETDQSGRKTSYTYDVMHRITSSTDAEGNVTKFAYDAAGNLKSLTTAKGYVTEYQYDALDRITKLLDPVGKEEQYTYDPVGNLTSVVENGGRATRYGYDKVGNMTSLTNAAGYTKTLVYDAVDRLVSESDFKGKTVNYGYDRNSNLTSVKDRIGNTTLYTYDSVNNQTSEVDAEGRRKDYTYDALGRLTAVTEDKKYTSVYAYDKVGNLVVAGGYVYSYDLNGNLTSSMNALGDITSYVYNENGMLQTVRNADGTTVHYDYDKLDQLISKKYDEQTVALYGYDADGNRVSMEDVAGTSSYAYDELGRVSSITLPDEKSKITYEYDVYGNLTKLGYPDGTSVSYKYDALNQLVSVTNRDGEKTAYKYDANGNVTEVHRPNDTYTLISYNENDQITSLINYGMIKFLWFFKKTVPVSTYRYEYDGSGNITGETVSSFSTTGENDFISWLIAKIKNEYTSISYQYDGRNQLVKQTKTVKKWFSFGDSESISYEYDASGNRIGENNNGEKTTYSYNKAGQLISKKDSNGETTYTYDKNGNLIKEVSPACLNKSEAKTYSYDNENRLTAIKENGSLLMAALYDGDGERIFVLSDRDSCSLPCCDDKNAKNLSKQSGTVTVDKELIYDTLLIPNGVKECSLGDYDLTGYINNINAEYTQVLMEYGANGKITSAYEYGVNRESAKIDGDHYYYEYDGKGSVIALTNTRGKNSTTYSYDPYGNTEISGSSVENPYQYNAEYVDNATGLQYLRARYYRAETGSFITADTYRGNISNPLSLNRYTYTHNNPIMGKDPSGHWSLKGAINSAGNWLNKNVVQPVKKTVNNIKTGVQNFFNNTKTVVTNTVKTVQEKCEEIKDTATNYYNQGKQILKSSYDYATQQIQRKLCEGKEKLNQLWDATVDTLKNVDWGKVANVALVATAGIVMTAAVIATAGAAGAAIGLAAGMYLGASAATMATVTSIATAGAYLVAGGIAVTTASDVGEIVSDGHNVVRDDVLGSVLDEESAEKAYDATRYGLLMAGSAYITIGANNQSLSTNKKENSTKSTQELTTSNTKSINTDLSEQDLSNAKLTGESYRLTEERYNSHIIDEHGPNSTYANKSKFTTGFDIKQGIDDAIKSPDTINGNTNGRPGYIFEKDFGYTIGQDGTTNQPVTKIKVVLNPDGTVKTAYPKQ